MCSKRFTDTEKWKKLWFQKLKPKHKALWEYLRDNCDAAGVIECNFQMASFFINESVTEEDLKFFGNRIIKLPNGKLLIRKFIKFQYGRLTETSPPHRTIFRLIKQHGIQQFIDDSYNEDDENDEPTSVFKQGAERPSPKPVEIVQLPYGDAFAATWQEWVQYRTKIKKSYKTVKSQQEQVDWFTKEGMGEDEAVACIRQSIRNEWQGIFKIKNDATNKSTNTASKGGISSRNDDARKNY